MALQFKCSSCGAKVLVRYLQPGEMAKCRNCGVLTRVPESSVSVDEDPDYFSTYPQSPKSFATQFTPPVIGPAEPQGEPLSEDEQILLKKAQKAVRHAVRAGIVVAALTFIIVLVAISIDSKGTLSNFDAWNLFDVVIVLGLVYGIVRNSRASAVVLFVYYLFCIMYNAIGGTSGILGALVILIFLGRGIWGTYVVTRLHRKSGVKRKPLNRWFLVPTGILAVPVVFLLGVGILIAVGLIPDTKAVAGNKLSGHMRSRLEDYEIVTPGERIHYFYSDGLLSVLEDGNFFTDDRAVSYVESDSGIWVYEACWEDISSIIVVFPGSATENTVIEVTTFDNNRFRLWVSAEEGLDSVFYAQMFDMWQQKRDRLTKDATAM
jgi:hypothetical protein